MLDPGLADLLKALVIAGSATPPIEVMRNRRMIRIGHPDEMRWLISSIT
jgi:hypothetical protein